MLVLFEASPCCTTKFGWKNFKKCDGVYTECQSCDSFQITLEVVCVQGDGTFVHSLLGGGFMGNLNKNCKTWNIL